jgi:hypothetical protein
VVYNSNDPDSKALAEYYATRRKIPPDQLVALSCSTDEEIERDDYDTAIAEPLRACFSQKRWWNAAIGPNLETRVTRNRIRFVAIIRGIPLKIRFKALWYSDKISGVLADPTFRFSPGAVAVHLHSFSAASIRSLEHNWVGPLLHHGAAATLGNVYEPFLALSPALDIFHDRLLQGMTFAESAYASIRPISWMTTCVGDPLYRPFSDLDQKGAPDTNPFVVFRDLTNRDKGNSDQLIKDLLQQGATNPLFFEFAGVLAEHQSQPEIALNAFTRARQGARNHTDKLRALIDALGLLLKLDRKQEMVALIDKEQTEFPEMAAQDIFKFYRFQ